MIKRCPRNTQGRDFVVGDIHGCFGKVRQALKLNSFNEKTDRLFCVGDTVNRGPESEQFIEFISQPWVFSVRGNHEQMLLDVILGTDNKALEFHAKRNGMDWFRKIKDSSTINAIQNHIENLPHVIELDYEYGTVGIIHAEVPLGMGWKDFTQSVQDKNPKVTEACLWGRTRVLEPNCSSVPGIDQIFCGHTPVQEITTLGNITYMDTGHVFSMSLDRSLKFPVLPIT